MLRLSLGISLGMQESGMTPLTYAYKLGRTSMVEVVLTQRPSTIRSLVHIPINMRVGRVG